MTTPENPSARSRNRLTLILIAAVFVAPIVIAALFAQGFFDVSQRHRLNHGTFITPPINLSELPSFPAAAPLRGLAPADWAIVYIDAGACDANCAKVLTELATIRTLVGKEGTRVSVFGLLGANQDNPAPGLPRLLVDQSAVDSIGAELKKRDAAAVLPVIAFLDWRGMVMMRFSPDAPPADIKDDLQRLLRASAIR